jgi:hypothetical protein
VPIDPVVQSLIDLIEPPEEGHRAGGTSDFGADRDVGTTPHVGVDMNRGRGVPPHGSVRSPVFGKVTEVHPHLGRIVIEEWDPIRKEPTGYHVEILHTQTQSVKPTDLVEPRQQIGTQGDVGARGAFHAHIQILHGAERTPINPLRHLFEYHNPGKPVPPLRQFQPERLPPRNQGGSAAQSANQRQPPPGIAPSDPPAGATPSQFPFRRAIPGAEGPTSIGGPAGPTPLESPGLSRSRAPFSPAPVVDPTLPPLHFAPEAPRSSDPFAVPGAFRPDVSGGSGVESGTNPPSLLTPSFAASRVSPEATPPAVLRGAGPMGDGNGIGDWWGSLASVPSSDAAPDSVRRLSSFIRGTAETDPNSSVPSSRSAALTGAASRQTNSPAFPPAWFPLEALLAPDHDRALDQWASSSWRDAFSPMQRASTGLRDQIVPLIARDDPSNPDRPPAGGLLGMIQEYRRNNGE